MKIEKKDVKNVFVGLFEQIFGKFHAAFKSSWSLLLGFQDLNQTPMKLDAELDFSTFA